MAVITVQKYTNDVLKLKKVFGVINIYTKIFSHIIFNY